MSAKYNKVIRITSRRAKRFVGKIVAFYIKPVFSRAHLHFFGRCLYLTQLGMNKKLVVFNSQFINNG